MSIFYDLEESMHRSWEKTGATTFVAKMNANTYHAFNTDTSLVMRGGGPKLDVTTFRCRVGEATVEVADYLRDGDLVVVAQGGA